MNFNSQNPSAPSAGLTLFNSEEQSDVIFLVSSDSTIKTDKWRFPAHSFIIRESCPLLHNFITCPENFSGYTDSKPTIYIQCKPDIFYLMMSFIYTREANIKDINSAILLHQIADKFLLPELMEICCEYLCSNLNDDNVLQIFTFIIANGEKDLNDNCVKNFPLSIDEIYLENGNNNNNCIVDCEKDLINQCLAIIDAKADKILNSDEILKTNSNILRKILFRDSLNLSNELIAFQCIDRWCKFQCEIVGLQLTPENKMKLCDDLIYSIRYLVMNLDDYDKGPNSRDLLPEYDRAVIRMAISEKSEAILPDHLRPFKLGKSRRYIKPTQLVTPQPRKADTIKSSSMSKDADNLSNDCNQVANLKKKGPMKKFLNGLGEVMICVIQLLD